MNEKGETIETKKKKLRLSERFGGPPVLLLLAAGLLLLLFGGGLFSSRGETGAATDPAAYRRSLESELASLCAEIGGVGRVSVMITLKEGEKTTYNGSKTVSVSPPSVLGAAVVCDGGDDPEVRTELTRLVSALLGIGSNRVTVSRRRP